VTGLTIGQPVTEKRLELLKEALSGVSHVVILRDVIDRRTFIGGMAEGLVAAPLAAEAQPARVYGVGVVLLGGPQSSTVDGLGRAQGVRTRGGKQFVFHVHAGKGDLKSVEVAARSLEGEQRLEARGGASRGLASRSGS
jgi:hypothetical protein